MIDTIESISQGSFKGDLAFPDVVKKLMDGNVAHYYTDLITFQKTYYAIDGSIHTSKLPYTNSSVIGNIFSEKDVVEALRAIQRGDIEYPEFLDRIIRAGVINYTAFLLGKQVHYVGAKGDIYIEHFPGQDKND